MCVNSVVKAQFRKVLVRARTSFLPIFMACVHGMKSANAAVCEKCEVTGTERPDNTLN